MPVLPKQGLLDQFRHQCQCTPTVSIVLQCVVLVANWKNKIFMYPEGLSSGKSILGFKS